MKSVILLLWCRTWALAAVLAATLLATGPAVGGDLEARKAAFRELEFGMFIHFNMATYQGKEWVEGYPSPSEFAPGVEVIDTDAWAEAAKAAGMTYAVLTTKHVGGFCLWDSELTEYDIMHPDCPYQRDLVGQFVKSFTERGLKVGLYYCWRHPGFKKQFKVLPPECDPAEHDMAQQIDFQKRQIAELVKKYPECFYLWNDALDDQIMSAEAAREWIRSLDAPLVACGNWWDWGKKGQPFLDVSIKEMRHFPEGHTALGETCYKLEQGWFWREGCKPGKAAAQLDRMDTAAARNSNFLLNVAPDRDGRIVPASVEVLHEIGRLLKAREQ